MPEAQREEVLNTILAQCICESGLAAAPELILRSGTVRAMPDVIISYQGLRCAIEGKMGDTTDPLNRAISAANGRILSGIAQMAIAVVYPSVLRSTAFSRLKPDLNTVQIAYCICTEIGAGTQTAGPLASILDELRRVHSVIAQDDLVARSVERLELGMQSLVSILGRNPACCSRLADILGIYEKPSSAVDRADHDSEDDEDGEN